MKRILLIMSVLFAQANAQTITNYSIADGLLSDGINCVEVDYNNQVWVGTNSGLSMYDGASWTGYTTVDGLVDNNVKTIAATSAGDIWVGTDFGVSKFDGSTWITFTTADGLALNQIADIACAPNGDLWFAHASFSAGVTLFDGVNWSSFGSPDLPISGVMATSFDNNGDKWFASPLDGVIHYDGSTFTAYTNTSVGLVSNYSTTILCHNDEKWIGTSSGISVLDATNFSVTNHTIMYVLPPPDTLNPVVDLAKDGYGRIWTTIYVGYLAEGGVACWDGVQWEDFDVSDGIAGPNVRGLEVDAQNNIWVATSTGLSKITPLPGSGTQVLSAKGLYPVYPNPTSNFLQTTAKGEKRCYNLIGELVFVTEAQRLDISHLPTGVYYLKSKQESVKFLKQ